MINLTDNYIRDRVADSRTIFQKGKFLYRHGSYYLLESDPIEQSFAYRVDGNYGDYTTMVRIKGDEVVSSCTCPYPGEGCKHVVAAVLNARDILMKQTDSSPMTDAAGENRLSESEIRDQALQDRKKRAGSEGFRLVRGDMMKGDHVVVNPKGRNYGVCFHDPLAGVGHCTCPDYLTNGLGTCKHILFAASCLKKESGFKKTCDREIFPFVDIYWNSLAAAPGVFYETTNPAFQDLAPVLDRYFDGRGLLRGTDMVRITDLMDELGQDKRVRLRESLLKQVDRLLEAQTLDAMTQEEPVDWPLKTGLYPYQAEGVRFGLFKPGVLIGDEMGLGKTLQAITLGILKKERFGFERILVVTLASLKEQWKREIQKFTDERAVIVEGGQSIRKQIYFNEPGLFKITNYEAVLRDVTILTGFKPDLIILDEAQRIRNFSTKTADAVKQIPRKHAIVLTGTPLENKLEDVYSIIQFLDPYMLAPLWRFAADHFIIPKTGKSGVVGYRNLDVLNEKLKRIVIRRRKEDVLKDLPGEIINNYYVDLTREQEEIHGGLVRLLLPLIHKKFLTPMDVRKIQMLLLKMRMVCDSTYLIDRETHLSPKLTELQGIIEEIAIQNRRKMVIFSEWTTMTCLIARTLSDMSVPFVELSGRIPVHKRQALIDEFSSNPDCRVFLSTDAGGTGLNLQAADCVVNFELPWNPARVSQRIGRVSRIGQESTCINVINFIAKNSIEEKILAGIQIKTDLFKGVFDQGPDTVEFSREKKNEMLNRLREMMGEEPEPAVPERAEPDEIPEDLPGYLNPKVLGAAEEDEQDPAGLTFESREKIAEDRDSEDQDSDVGEPRAQDPERMEAVLNSGMQFLTGLMEMATGRTMKHVEGRDKMIVIDRITGEVTLKFKLPGF